MKKIFIFLVLAIQLIAGMIKTPLVTLDNNNSIVTINADAIDVGMSGFIVQQVAQKHTTILKSAVVLSFDKKSKIATLKLSDYMECINRALPVGSWSVKVGDMAILGFGYRRALLIAPNEEIYYRISKNVKIQWVHPDIFASILSLNGHPTPLKEDFDDMIENSAIGIIFIYLEQKLYTIDAKSFVILHISDAPLEQKSVMLPFYSRVQDIEANWWGEGSNKLENYESYYYKLLEKYNPKNKNLKLKDNK